MWGATLCKAKGRHRAAFQSTLPVWGATDELLVRLLSDGLFQSTLPVWGATLPHLVNGLIVDISIHAPRVGSDKLREVRQRRREAFQSTLPVWGATMTWTSWATSWPFQSTLPVWGATCCCAPWAGL